MCETLTDFGCDDIGFVARKGDAACYMNMRVSVQHVKFE